VLVGVGLALTGCESTQDKAERLRASGAAALNEKGLTVAKRHPDVAVSKTTVLSDENGTAAVAFLRNKGSKPLGDVQVGMDVQDRRGRSQFKNDEPGLEPGLVSMPLLKKGESVVWVHDQIPETDRPAKKVEIKPGMAVAEVPPKVPKLEISPPKLRNDPYSGLYVRGRVKNRSKVDQRRLILFGVARRGGRVVAAGRGGIERLPPGASRLYRIFFIGNPKGASYTIDAPPTILE
jgi:hypothetical protein